MPDACSLETMPCSDHLRHYVAGCSLLGKCAAWPSARRCCRELACSCRGLASSRRGWGAHPRRRRPAPFPRHPLLNQAPPSQTDITALQAGVQALEAELRGAAPGPGVAFKMTQLAVALHQLNTFVPDGGSRYPRARQLYEAVVQAESPDSGLHTFALVNLAALHLSAGEAGAALDAMQRARRLCARHQARARRRAAKGGSGGGGGAPPAQILEQCHSNDFNLAKLHFNLGEAGEGEELIRAGLLSPAVLQSSPEVYSKVGGAG